MSSEKPFLCRSVLYVPGSNARAMEKALTLGADALIFDLEDSVAPEAKSDARQQVAKRLAASQGSPILRTVRINGMESNLWQDDLAAVLPSGPDAIALSKVDDVGQIEPLVAEMKRLFMGGPVPIWAMIESPKGVINAYAIASHRWVSGLVMGTSDLSEALHIKASVERLPMMCALQQVILAARAADTLVVDGVFLDLNDPQGFARQCQQAADLGFDGKTIIHPKQVAPANQAFLPSLQEVERAERLVEAWEAARKRGEEICLLDGKLVERLHVRDAKRILSIASAAQHAQA